MSLHAIQDLSPVAPAPSIGPDTRRVVYVALAGNLLVTATKLGAALWTGSSAMLSEAVHSFVDTGNELLLLYGMHRARLWRRVVPQSCECRRYFGWLVSTCSG